MGFIPVGFCGLFRKEHVIMVIQDQINHSLERRREDTIGYINIMCEAHFICRRSLCFYL